MTKDRKRKHEARERAARDGIRYTEALRAVAAERVAPPDDEFVVAQLDDTPDTDADAVTPRAEPTFDERVRRGLPWADVFLDGRRAHEFDRVPEVLPAPGDLTPGAGTLEVPLPEGAATVSAHVVTGMGKKASVVIRVVYPDGLVLAGADMCVGEYNWPVEQVWREYLTHHLDGFVGALTPRSMWREVHRRDRAGRRATGRDRARQAFTAVRMLRSAIEGIDDWFAPDGPPEGTAGGNAAGDMFVYSSLGFASFADVRQVMDQWALEHTHVVAAQNAGLSLANANDREWMAIAGAQAWPDYLEGGWGAVVAARDEGMPLAMDVIAEVVRRLRAKEDGRPIPQHVPDGPVFVRDLGRLRGES